MDTIRIATRGSAQATTQAIAVAKLLQVAGHDSELVVVDTYGDRTQASNVPLHSIGGQGVFVKEVQNAVLDGRAHLAVHSAKDLPSVPQEGLSIGAFTERRSPADALVGRSLDELPIGAEVATGSVRRRAQLGRVRNDLTFLELRGNIPSRLEKVPDGGAIVVAVAALEVLGLVDLVAQVLDPTEFVPAVGQGCVAVECRDDDVQMQRVLGQIDHPATRHAVLVERAFMAELGTGCSLPLGAFSTPGKLFTFLAGDNPVIVSHDMVSLTGDLEVDVRAAAAAARVAHEMVGDR